MRDLSWLVSGVWSGRGWVLDVGVGVGVGVDGSSWVGVGVSWWKDVAGLEDSGAVSVV